MKPVASSKFSPAALLRVCIKSTPSHPGPEGAPTRNTGGTGQCEVPNLPQNWGLGGEFHDFIHSLNSFAPLRAAFLRASASPRDSSIFRRALLSTVCIPLLSGCNFAPKPGVADLPPLPSAKPGVYTDINPRWSNDGGRIAFLRSTPDRRLQLFVTDDDLDQATALLEPELVSPDRQYDPRLSRYASPNTLAWSPDDRRIAFERAEWFQFEDGQRLPGTGIWAFDLRSGRVAALALHPKRYTNLYYYYHTPSWSPDGSYVAFVAEGVNGQHALGLRCTGVEMPKEVAPRFDNYASSDWPSWRPDLTAAREAKGVEPERPVLTYCQAIFRTPNIRTTAALRAIQPGSATQAQCRELWRITPAQYAATDAVRQRSNPRDMVEPRAAQPAWSRDGQRVACTLTPDPNDLSRYEVWVVNSDNSGAKRVSPLDERGYIAPVWIDERRLGALSPNQDRFDVVTIDIVKGTVRRIGTIDTADCDWSPDRRQIVYAPAPSGRVNSPDDPTTLRILDTHLSLPVPGR